MFVVRTFMHSCYLLSNGEYHAKHKTCISAVCAGSFATIIKKKKIKRQKHAPKKPKPLTKPKRIFPLPTSMHGPNPHNNLFCQKPKNNLISPNEKAQIFFFFVCSFFANKDSTFPFLSSTKFHPPSSLPPKKTEKGSRWHLQLYVFIIINHHHHHTALLFLLTSLLPAPSLSTQTLML